MCGRFISGADETSWEEYCEILRLPTSTEAPLEGDRSPTQDISSVRAGAAGARECIHLRWGLIPHWQKEKKSKYKLINIRSETVHTKFRTFLDKKRCIIPAAGFYEWKKKEESKEKVKHLIRDTARPLISMAGLWSRWAGPDDEVIESCAILTTEPNDVVSPIHNRMPVILLEDALDTWLDPDADTLELKALLKPYEASTLIAEPLEPSPSTSSQGELF